MVKIGRTDVSVEHRLGELSKENYGPSSFEGNSEWEAVRIIVVDDSVEAEKILHDHFSSSRVEGNRELFYTENPEVLSNDAMELVGGEDILNFYDASETLFDALGVVSIASGIVISASIFSNHPNIKKAEKFLNDWEEKLNLKFRKSSSLTEKTIYGFLNWSFGMSKFIGSFYPLMAKELLDNIRPKKVENLTNELNLSQNSDYISNLNESIQNYNYLGTEDKRIVIKNIKEFRLELNKNLKNTHKFFVKSNNHWFAEKNKINESKATHRSVLIFILQALCEMYLFGGEKEVRYFLSNKLFK